MDLHRQDTKIHPIGRSVACYFCNEFFEEKYLQNHITQCGSVLEPCPKKCGAYVQRSSKDKHILNCRFKKTRPKSTHDYLEISPAQNSLQCYNIPLENLETELITLKSALSEEKRFRFELQIELQRLHKLFQKSEEFNKHLNHIVEQLKRSSFEDLEKRKSNNIESKLEIDKIHLQYQVLDEWKKQIDASVEYVKNRLIENDNKLLDTEYSTKNIECRLGVINRLELDINMLHQKVNDSEFNRQEEAISWRGELNDFKDFFAEENKLIAAVWSDQQKEIENLKKSIEIQTNSLSDFKTKYQAIIFDTKSVSQIANESSDRLDSQNKELKNFREMFEQLKLDFEGFQETVVNNNIAALPTGHLLWKIDNFQLKMDNAKENNTLLRSPIFNSSLYGYKLRMEIYLNGIKKWKGRHIIISLHVLKGEWDPLLTWPCNIEAKVLLRDQNHGKSLTKYIKAKRLKSEEDNEDPQESSSQYIFIPHSSLDKQEFIKDDIMFIEIIIINDKITTSL